MMASDLQVREQQIVASDSLLPMFGDIIGDLTEFLFFGLVFTLGYFVFHYGLILLGALPHSGSRSKKVLDSSSDSDEEDNNRPMVKERKDRWAAICGSPLRAMGEAVQGIPTALMLQTLGYIPPRIAKKSEKKKTAVSESPFTPVALQESEPQEFAEESSSTVNEIQKDEQDKKCSAPNEIQEELYYVEEELYYVEEEKNQQKETQHQEEEDQEEEQKKEEIKVPASVDYDEKTTDEEKQAPTTSTSTEELQPAQQQKCEDEEEGEEEEEEEVWTDEERLDRIQQFVDELVEYNDEFLGENGMPKDGTPDEPISAVEDMGFVASEIPGLGVGEYLSSRLVRFGRLDPTRLLVALALIQRLGESPGSEAEEKKDHQKEETEDRRLRILSSWSGHRLLLVASLLASKMYQDATFNLGYWAGVGGVELSELLRLEMVFLERINWRASISVAEYQALAKRVGVPENLEPSNWD